MQITFTLTDIATDGGCPSVSQWKTGVHPYCQPLPTLVDSHWGSSTFWKFHPPLSSLVETHSSTTTTCWLIVSVDWQSFLQIAPIMKLQCFYRNDGRYHCICQRVLELALLLFWCCCTSIVQLPLVIWSPLCTTTPILWKFYFHEEGNFCGIGQNFANLLLQ